MNVNNKEGYKVPDNYFQSSKAKSLKMLADIQGQEKSLEMEVHNKSTRHRLYQRVSIAASLLLVVYLISHQPVRTDKALSDIDEAELLSYIETHIDDYTLDELSDLSELGLELIDENDHIHSENN